MVRMAPTAPRRRAARAAVLAAAGALIAAPAGARAADAPLLYLEQEAAAVVHDGMGVGTLRQAPLRPNPRWPAARTVGKVAGRDLAGAGPRRIAAMLRAGWAQPGVGSLVAVDEISPRQWSASAARSLAAALVRLGPNASRVVFYAGPALVEQVGRADPRHPLPGRLRALVDALSRGRATYLLTYRGDLFPLPPREMATAPTRWLARWPAGRGELRVLLGVDGGLGQAELWARVRSTPAGRELLSRGPGAYGLRGAAEAHDWLAQYRAHRASPGTSATGVDYPVPQPGGLALEAAGPGRVRLTIARPGSAVVTTQPLGGGFVRAIRKLTGPTRGSVLIRLPEDSRPGRYRVRAVLIGDGLRDRAGVIVKVTRN
jgi:hypothetical protein